MKVYKESCKNCLLSVDSIVSVKRRKEIIKDCVKKQSHFICHKASMNGDDICCKTYFDKLGHASQLIRIAQRLNLVEFVPQPESDKLPSHSDIINDR